MSVRKAEEIQSVLWPAIKQLILCFSDSRDFGITCLLEQIDPHNYFEYFLNQLQGHTS
jgi:hypothetical protein